MPIRSRKTETSSRMGYGVILNSIDNVQSAAKPNDYIGILERSWYNEL